MEPAPTAAEFSLRATTSDDSCRDAAYRARREAVADLAARHVDGQAPPRVPYTEREHALWRSILTRIAPLHDRRVCAEVRAMLRAFPLDPVRIPQLGDVSARIEAATGFRMEPVPGLIEPRVFLEDLADGVFRATQYVRHPDAALHAEEPDVVHELIGHAATLADPRIAELHRAFGRAAREANDEQLQRLERAYWHALEHGAVMEEGEPKAFGAALLSSCLELESFTTTAGILPWNPIALARADYDPPTLQRVRFVAPSFARLCADLSTWLDRGGWRVDA
jgi:phenylalanine-4-hydroxylase